jgi:hypothetical protein
MILQCVRPALGALLAPLLALAACDTAPDAGDTGKNGDGVATEVGLNTSLPILWGESDHIGGFLDSGAHWAGDVLRSGRSLVPLDSLADNTGLLPMSDRGVLVLVQPRPFSPQENVALDTWVRKGGRVLLFVDPMLTAHSIYALGDARRPQDVAMLSPILARWGLILQFDDVQQRGEHLVELPEGNMPVNLPGRFALAGEVPDASGGCKLSVEAFVADCPIGKGRVVALADAALFEDARDGADVQRRRTLLGNLLRKISVGN